MSIVQIVRMHPDYIAEIIAVCDTYELLYTYDCHDRTIDIYDVELVFDSHGLSVCNGRFRLFTIDTELVQKVIAQ